MNDNPQAIVPPVFTGQSTVMIAPHGVTGISSHDMLDPRSFMIGMMVGVAICLACAVLIAFDRRRNRGAE